MDTREAHEALEAYRAEAEKALELRMDEMAARFQGIVDDLQGKLTSCRAELELTKREAELSRQWIVHISTEIMGCLGNAPMKLHELALETRAALAKLDPEPVTNASEVREA